MIKDMTIFLAQIPAKTLVIDVVVVDVRPNFGMLLSISWSEKLKGALQMDMSYSIIPVFGVHRRIYREHKLPYMVRSAERPNNHPIYSLDTEMGSSIFLIEGGVSARNCSHTTREQANTISIISIK